MKFQRIMESLFPRMVIYILFSFHPAAIIYNQKLKKVFENDMKKLVYELKKLKTKSGD